MSQIVDGRTTIRPLRSFGHDDLGRLHFSVGEIKDVTYTIPGEVSMSFTVIDKAGIPAWWPARPGIEYHFFGTLLFTKMRAANADARFLDDAGTSRGKASTGLTTQIKNIPISAPRAAAFTYAPTQGQRDGGLRSAVGCRRRRPSD
jgi:hypothetical protein